LIGVHTTGSVAQAPILALAMGAPRLPPAAVEQLEIRRARPAERDVLLAMWLRLIEHHQRLDPAYPVPGSLRLGLRSELDRGLTRPGCALWLALCGDAPLGFSFAEVEAGAARGDRTAVGWIHELWVEPGWRRRGVAAALVERARAFLAEQQGGRIAVRVEAANEAALAFWRAQGFRARAQVLELDDG
jgi:GNAT superfamily N-acetyltransferase